MTDEADEMDDPDVEPLTVLAFHDACVVAEGIASVEGVLLTWFEFPLEGGLAGPIRPLPVGFNAGIPPVKKDFFNIQINRYDWISPLFYQQRVRPVEALHC